MKLKRPNLRDNYWNVKGLLLSEMFKTVEGSLTNFLEMVKRFGFVPNGGRVYFTKRSQPPFLTLMVRDYVESSGDKKFMEDAFPTLEVEYSFWEKRRTIPVNDSEGNSHYLSRYASDDTLPRPESYREDYDLTQHLDEAKKQKLMMHITSACESGWDFSSRWTGSRYDDDSENKQTKDESQNLLLTLRTRDIIPVDLNSILSDVEKSLADFSRRLGNDTKAEMYLEKRRKRVEGMEKILWNGEDGTYYDYVVSKKTQNRQFFISNLNPMWTKAYPSSVDVDHREIRMYNYLQKQTFQGMGVLDFPGGVPTSLNDCGQQWDFPNAWPPLMHMLIEGLHKSNVQALKDEAFRQAQKYIKSCWRGFTNSKHPAYVDAMFEKYNALRDDGLPGGGGEYPPQEGFGWTNGVAMVLLDLYGDKLTVEGGV